MLIGGQGDGRPGAGEGVSGDLDRLEVMSQGRLRGTCPRRSRLGDLALCGRGIEPRKLHFD